MLTKTSTPPDAAPLVAALPNGVRVVVLPMPWLASASVSVFVRAGSQHESRRHSGISHLVEHMAFKGTRTRDCQRINLDAERLGAEVNAHTDKDHTAFHMHGLARHAGEFVRMLGDIVANPIFPPDELERERQVVLHELAEDEDDPMATAYKLFDRACWGLHAVAQPVIGNRASLQRLTRDDLLAHVHEHFRGGNVIVGVAGAVDSVAMLDAAAAAFGALPPGQGEAIAAPPYIGGVKTRRLGGHSQCHVVLGFPIPALAEDEPASAVAAAVLGEGMSSPLLDELRERRGLVYHAACSADVEPLVGQFVIEASTSPELLEPFFAEVTRLLLAQAEQVGPVDFERARNQLEVRHLRTEERAYRRIEQAAQDLYVHGRVRSHAERLTRMRQASAAQVREAFERLLRHPPAIAMVGRLRPGAHEPLLRALAARRG